MAGPEDDALHELLERCRRDHRAWINGDAAGYVLPDDGTILGGVGGHSFGGAQTAARQAGVAAQWQSGSGSVDLLNGAVAGEIAWLTFIERATVTFRGATEQRRWDLRVTEIFRRKGHDWERIHRHADPLVDRRPLSEVARILDVPQLPG